MRLHLQRSSVAYYPSIYAICTRFIIPTIQIPLGQVTEVQKYGDPFNVEFGNEEAWEALSLDWVGFAHSYHVGDGMKESILFHCPRAKESRNGRN